VKELLLGWMERTREEERAFVASLTDADRAAE